MSRSSTLSTVAGAEKVLTFLPRCTIKRPKRREIIVNNIRKARVFMGCGFLRDNARGVGTKLYLLFLVFHLI